MSEAENQLTSIEPRNGNRLVRLAEWLKPQADNDQEARRPMGLGLSGKLLGLAFLFVMLAEILIFVPSIANFRVNWLTERISAAQIAALAAKAAPDGQLPDMLRDELLNTANVRVISVQLNDKRMLILSEPMPGEVGEPFDLRTASYFKKIEDALDTLLMGSDRNIRVIGEAHAGSGQVMDIVVAERPLRDAMISFGVNVFGLSVVISLITATLIYYSLNGLFVRPMRRITANMVRFSMNPEDLSRIIHPSERKDELGVAESELAKMQSDISQMLHQKSRLASLGLAVSKINHDLRNMLANAQLISDRLGSVQDPTVQRLTPKLIASIDRAIRLCTDTLNFGKADETVPMRHLLALRPLLVEVGESLGLPRQGLDLAIEVDPGLEIDADSDQLFRVFNNLIRNSAQVLDSMEPPRQNRISVIARREGRGTTVIVKDTGPGVPPKAKENLFVPFQGSSRKGGTGLGLAIVAEIVTAHGGEIMLLDGTEGAAFRFTIPDVGSARLATEAA